MELVGLETADKTKRVCTGGPESSGYWGRFKGSWGPGRGALPVIFHGPGQSFASWALEALSVPPHRYKLVGFQSGSLSKRPHSSHHPWSIAATFPLLK